MEREKFNEKDFEWKTSEIALKMFSSVKMRQIKNELHFKRSLKIKLSNLMIFNSIKGLLKKNNSMINKIIWTMKWIELRLKIND